MFKVMAEAEGLCGSTVWLRAALKVRGKVSGEMHLLLPQPADLLGSAPALAVHLTPLQWQRQPSCLPTPLLHPSPCAGGCCTGVTEPPSLYAEEGERFTVHGVRGQGAGASWHLTYPT